MIRRVLLAAPTAAAPAIPRTGLAPRRMASRAYCVRNAAVATGAVRSCTRAARTPKSLTA
jgi:hypothetical protein